MADIDPITREALRRAAHMQSRPNQNHPKPPENHRPEEQPRPPKPPEPKPDLPCGNNFGLEALFKDKETSVILILIILLMGEKDSEHLLLALIYLLL